MKLKRAALTLGVVALSAPILAFVGAGTASADYAPQPGDVVGVGGDTPQYAIDFAINGDNLGDQGFDSSATVNRTIFFDAVADGNGRASYAQGSTTAAPLPLNPTNVLRAGKSPVQRNQSSGNAISALLADTGSSEQINFIGSASLPTAAQQSAAAADGWNFLHVVEIGTDAVQIAAASTTNAPAGLSVADLLNIYDGTYVKWGDIPTYTGSAPTAAIIPLLPPSSSTITKTLLADIKAANGGTAPTLAHSVQTVEQNDPTAITGLGATNAPNAIVPFSLARSKLFTSGYFLNPATVFPGGTPLSSGIVLRTGYSSPITDYVIFRDSDLASTTPVQPGASLNWAQSLFSNPSGTPYFKKGATATLLAASGITPTYADLGNVSSG